MTDKTLTCRDCGTSFVFTSSEQEFFASKGFTNEPGRCPDCRGARKADRAGGNSSGYSSGYASSGYGRREREMFPVICSECGKSTQVPFQPRSDRPVYCSDCFERQRGSSRTSGGRSDRNRW